MKKKNKELELKSEIVTLKEKLTEVANNERRLKNILDDLGEFLDMTLYFDSGTSMKSLRKKVAELAFFRKEHEGAYHPLRETVETQREIIRWLIKPSSADNAEELKRLKDPRTRGY